MLANFWGRLRRGWLQFRAWADLTTVGKAADLALKLGAIVALFAFLSFFKARGDVYATANCWTSTGLGDLEGNIAQNLRLTPAEAAVPEAAIRALDREPAIPLGIAEDSMRIGCGRSLLAIEDLRSGRRTDSAQLSYLGRALPHGALTQQQRSRRMQLLEDLYPDAGDGKFRNVPAFAVVIASSPTLALERVRDVIELIESERLIKVIVRVENVGKADALNVTIPPPSDFALSDRTLADFDLPREYAFLAEPDGPAVVDQGHPTIDLGSGDEAYFVFEGASSSRLAHVSEADVVPEADTEPSIDVTKQLLFIAALFGVILVPLIVKDIRQDERDRRPAR